MTLPPSLLRIRIANKETRFSLSLPLFLIWPLILLVMVILSPLVLIGALAVANGFSQTDSFDRPIPLSAVLLDKRSGSSSGKFLRAGAYLHPLTMLPWRAPTEARNDRK